MVHTADINIGTKHGDACTCKQLDPIVIQPVIVADDCPGRLREHFHTVAEAFQQPPHMGRVTITWPAARNDALPLFSREMQIHDADTGQPILTVTGMQIVLGGEAWRGEAIHVDLTMLADAEGQPILDGPGSANKAYDRDNGVIRTGVFRYAVMEMRTAAADNPEG